MAATTALRAETCISRDRLPWAIATGCRRVSLVRVANAMGSTELVQGAIVISQKGR